MARPSSIISGKCRGSLAIIAIWALAAALPGAERAYRYQLAADATTSGVIYDAKDAAHKPVAQAWAGVDERAGEHLAVWDGLGYAGDELAGGDYRLEVVVDGATYTDVNAIAGGFGAGA